MVDSGLGPGDVGIGGGGTLGMEEYDQSNTSASTAVIEAIASVEDVEPDELSSPEGITLYDYVDSDALDRLFAQESKAHILSTFLVNGYRVWIEGDKIAIADRESTSNGPSDTDP